MYVASDAPDPAGACMPCLRPEVCAALLSCWCSLSSRPGYLLHFSPTGTHSPVGHLASLLSSFLLSGAILSMVSLARLKSSAKLEYARELNMRTVVGYLEHKRICGMVDVQTYVCTIKLFHYTR